MMKLMLAFLVVLISPPFTFSLNLTDILPFVNNDTYEKNDLNFAETKDHQVKLYFNYRGLYDFRRHYHPQAKEDFDQRSGSVLFLNWGNEVFTLKCPTDGNVDRWEEFGAGVEGKYFNEEYTKDKGPHQSELSGKSPRGYYYYRTFGCFVGDKFHYFNVFHRPFAQTDFPVSMTEKEENKDQLTFGCWVAKEKIYTEEPGTGTPFPDCNQQPFTFGWIFPNELKKMGMGEIGSKNKRKMGDGFPLVRYESTTAVYNNLTITAGEDAEEGKDVNLRYTKRNGEKIEVLSSSKVTITTQASNTEHAGLYECVATDKNGLSSAFKFDNLESIKEGSNQDNANKILGDRRNPAIVYVHIRHWYWVFVPLGVAVLIFLLTVICVYACPDNKEEYEEQILEEANQRRADKLRAQKEAAEAAKSAKGKKGSKSTTTRNQTKAQVNTNAKDNKSELSRTPAPAPIAGTSSPLGRQALLKGSPPGQTASVKGAPAVRPVSPVAPPVSSVPSKASKKSTNQSKSPSARQPSNSEDPPPHKKVHHHKKRKHVDAAVPAIEKAN